ncbi:helix-turn-helix domain-containing protein [Clostridium vincentii]|uniref:Anaerobic benzoate catabolism transcriptional regulator n=1 Tax=Clostridium vincentii TaxID=52704 RepID=A0A2T0BDI2_9CLOT|nr:XRE family transcriptional regulator [Clostridium vincentii]PRR81905.1 anaerobic benzoate catabolism transcriptional regulator [Clostridium vincentii]
MDYINRNVSINLKTIRKRKKMSLTMVAEQTGVSKSMLGQIERGESNPTVAILGKIVSGLRVSFNDLVSIPKEEIYIVKKESLTPTKELVDGYSVYTYFPYEEDTSFEIYVVEIKPGYRYISGSHGENTSEYVNVFKGVLTLEVEDKTMTINNGDAVRFNTDKDHIYINNGDDLLAFNMIFHWK